MGEPLKNRKHKFNKVAGSPKNNKLKDAETTVEDTNENDVSKAKTKVKKNKMAAFAGISEMPIESKNDIDISDMKSKKAKKNKNKVMETPAEEKNVSEAKTKNAKKMKFMEMSNETTESDSGKPKAKKSKKNKSVKPEEQNENEDSETALKTMKKNEVVETSGGGDNTGITEEMIAQYPILKDEEVIKKFQAVHLTNNQKGRIRAHMKQQLKGTSEAMLPDAINIKIQAILKSEDPQWMKVRILFNMLKQALRGERPPMKKEKIVKKEKPQKENGKDEKPEQKVKGPKRYVVFMGNLPLDISKEKILEHFSDLSDNIKGVRIPKPLENKKSAIAYVEVANELTYELALSKHHTMLDNRRINVLYSTQKETKISKAEAKGKAAKLVAMQKSGQLAGSVPLSNKRSARRKKMKLALKKGQEAAERGV